MSIYGLPHKSWEKRISNEAIDIKNHVTYEADLVHI